MKEGVARSASVRGDDHRYYGEPRQDSAVCFSVTDQEHSFVVLGVADGVGSQPMSHIGSYAALLGLGKAPNAWQLLADGRHQEAALAFATSAQREVVRFASGYKVDPIATSTTLTFAVIWSDAAGGRNFVVARVGDSEAHLIRGAEWIALFGNSADADLESTGTYCLPSNGTVPEVVAGTLLPGDVLLVCTDGFAGTLNAAGRREHLQQSWQTPPSLTELLWQVDASVRSYGDDRSVAAWWELP